MRFLSSSAFSALLIVMPVALSAAESADRGESVQEINAFVSAWPVMCKAMVRQSLSNLQLKSIVDAVPSIESNACACVEKRMQADPYIGLLYTLPLATFRTRVDEGKFRHYFMGKIMSFTMVCIAVEVERSTDGFDPSKEG